MLMFMLKSHNWIFTVLKVTLHGKIVIHLYMKASALKVLCGQALLLHLGQ
ncbi:hypothetical protein FKM82_006326 [Ascaphus truei]